MNSRRARARASRRLDGRSESCRSLAVILVHDRRALCRLDAAGFALLHTGDAAEPDSLGLVGEPGRAWRFSIDKSIVTPLAALPLLTEFPQ